MDIYLNKKFKLKTSDKFEDYLKFIGVGLISRKAACSVTPVVTITQNDDGTYTFTMITALKNIISKFRLGEEFIEERPDGTKVKSVFKLENGKLVQIQTEDNGRKSTYVRELVDNTLIVTTTADGWPDKCLRTYEIVNMK